MKLRGLKRFGRGFAKGLKMTPSLLAKGARAGRGLLKQIDKYSGGAGTKFLMSSPEGQALYTGGNILADSPF